MERQKEARLRRERERREKMDREREARATARQAREAARAEERRRERDTQQRERVFRERGALREKALNTRPMPKADLLSMLGYAFLPPGLDRGSLSTSLTTSLASSRPNRGPNTSDITQQSGGDALAAGATASVSIRPHPSASVSKSGGDAFGSGTTAACYASVSPAEAASAGEMLPGSLLQKLPAAAAAAAAAAATLSLGAAAEEASASFPPFSALPPKPPELPPKPPELPSEAAATTAEAGGVGAEEEEAAAAAAGGEEEEAWQDAVSLGDRSFSQALSEVDLWYDAASALDLGEEREECEGWDEMERESQLLLEKEKTEEARLQAEEEEEFLREMAEEREREREREELLRKEREESEDQRAHLDEMEREREREKERGREQVAACAPSDEEKEWMAEVKAIVSCSGWRKLQSDGGVTVFGKESGGEHFLKAVGVVEARVPSVLRFLQNRVGNFNKLSNIGSTLKVVKRTDSCRGIWYSSFKLPWPLDNRDLVWETYDALLESGSAVCLGRSVVDKSVPPRPGFIRIDMKHSATLLEQHPANSEHTTLTFVAQANLKGWIPGWAISNASSVQGQMVRRVKENFSPKLKGQEGKNLIRDTDEWMVFMGACLVAT